VSSERIKKLFVCFLLFLLPMFFLTACNNQKTIILFNNNPITKQNLLENSTEFIKGQRVYYIFISEKPIDSDMVRVRIFKRDSKASNQPTKLEYSNDFKLRKDQIYYYDDYIMINDAGDFCMVVYATNNLKTPLAVADFRLKGMR
jgi:hypothetical protein